MTDTKELNLTEDEIKRHTEKLLARFSHKPEHKLEGITNIYDIDYVNVCDLENKDLKESE